MIRNFLVVICLGHGLKTTVQSLNIPFTATPLNVLSKPKEDSSLPNINDESTITAAPTLLYPEIRTVSSKLQNAWDEKKHPLEEPNELGNGIFLTDDWRKAWYSYDMKLPENGSEPRRDTMGIDSSTGYANYIIDEIDGTLPDDLVGTLYRNGPGKMGINGQRVAHALDGDGLVLQITFSPPSPDSSSGQRVIKFQSRFVQTKHFTEELNANRFVLRGTFGTGPLGTDPGPGIDEDPVEPSPWTKIKERAMNLNIKNPANTQVIAFGGKLLALFEAGLPYQLNPETLETIGEDTLNGILPSGNRLAVDIPTIPRNFLPDFLGGAAHTAHPQRCPRTGNLVGWHWTDVGNGLRITVTEWSSSNNGMIPVASRTVVLPNVALAPHDMVVTENYIVFLVNALSMNTLDFLSGMKGPAASLKMDGRADVKAFIISRPTSDMSVGPIEVQVPPCFCIHFSHGYEDEKSGNIVTFFSGWPPNDSKDFLGAWGGFAPEFSQIPQTFLWRLELDPVLGNTKSLSIAPDSSNVCAEHCVVHPNFLSKKANNVYAAVSNLVGDSSAPCGYSKHRVEDGYVRSLTPGERNDDIDCYFFGSRHFCGEPLVVPKEGADLDQEDEAYLLGIVCDAVAHRTIVSVFDLKLPLRNGPVANLWLKNHVPHGLHGCFDPKSDLNTSYFC